MTSAEGIVDYKTTLDDNSTRDMSDNLLDRRNHNETGYFI